MVIRFLAWLGAGTVVVGVSAGMLAGAGVAFAQDGSASDGGGTKTSESSKSTESKDDSKDTGASSTGQSGANATDTADEADATHSDTDTGEGAAGDQDTDKATESEPDATVVDSKGRNDKNDNEHRAGEPVRGTCDCCR